VCAWGVAAAVSPSVLSDALERAVVTEQLTPRAMKTDMHDDDDDDDDDSHLSAAGATPLHRHTHIHTQAHTGTHRDTQRRIETHIQTPTHAHAVMRDAACVRVC
jgi:hypothetical protein